MLSAKIEEQGKTGDGTICFTWFCFQRKTYIWL